LDYSYNNHFPLYSTF